MEENYYRFGDDVLVQMLGKDINNIPLLSKEEEKMLIQKAQSGDTGSRQRLIESHLRFVLKKAYMYNKNEFPLTELVAAGYVGLIRSLNTFDPERGNRFLTYADYGITQNIFKIMHTERKHSHESLDEPAYEDGSYVTKKDLLISEGIQDEKLIFSRKLKEWLQLLTDKERQMLRFKYWEDKTDDEIGELMKLSKGSIQFTMGKAIRKLRRISAGKYSQIHTGCGLQEKYQPESFKMDQQVLIMQ